MFSGKLSFANINKFLRTLSKVFIVCSALLIVYILIKFFMIRHDLSTLELENPENPNSQSAERLIPTSAPFSGYASTVSSRDFFKLPKEKPIVPKTVEQAPSANDVARNIKVTGLMLTNNPKVIVENQSTHETVILSIGDKIENLTLKSIQKDKLTFDYQGQSVEVAP